MPPLVLLMVALLALNAVSFLAFGWDKAMARGGRGRIPERTLLWLAVFGGSAGSIAGQRLFRHKTRKEPFRSRLNAIAGANLLCGAALAAWWVYPA